MHRQLPTRIIGCAVTALTFIVPARLHAQCTPVNWPNPNPVWSLCFVSPSQSSGIDGSGLEILNVTYKGHRVLDRAHVPILNFLYDKTSCQLVNFCGAPGRAYRDANNVLRAFDASTTPPKTVCDHPLTDEGTFAGVKVDALPSSLTLTTQTSVGWYRYPQSWTFFPDGSIHVGIGFTAVKDPCTSCPHTHNGYIRFDFDIDGSLDNVIEMSPAGSPTHWQAVNESPWSRGLAAKWRVRDRTTNRAYQIIPDPSDLGGLGSADPFAVADGWVLKFHAEEIDDGGASGFGVPGIPHFPILEFGGDEAHLNNYVNAEDVSRGHQVFWYRVAKRHSGSPSCVMAGPTLVPEPGWDRPVVALKQLAVSMTPALVTTIGAATRISVHAQDAVTHAKVSGSVLVNGVARGSTDTPLSLTVCTKPGAPKGEFREIQAARISVSAPGFEEASVDFSCKGEAP